MDWISGHGVSQSIREHVTRAMLDGQIHDIYKVGGTIKEVKAELEERIGRPLKDVCIAAAGRVLQTVTIRVDQELENDREITGEDTRWILWVWREPIRNFWKRTILT